MGANVSSKNEIIQLSKDIKIIEKDIFENINKIKEEENKGTKNPKNPQENEATFDEIEFTKIKDVQFKDFFVIKIL